jgi:hypothetical protein
MFLRVRCRRIKCPKSSTRARIHRYDSGLCSSKYSRLVILQNNGDQAERIKRAYKGIAPLDVAKFAELVSQLDKGTLTASSAHMRIDRSR